MALMSLFWITHEIYMDNIKCLLRYYRVNNKLNDADLKDEQGYNHII